jgi:hypothetical protein
LVSQELDFILSHFGSVEIKSSLLFEAIIFFIDSDFFFFVLRGICSDLVFDLLDAKKEVLVMIFELVKFFLFFGDFILEIFLFGKELKLVLSFLVVLLVNAFNELDFFFIKRTLIFLTFSNFNERISGGLL